MKIGTKIVLLLSSLVLLTSCISARKKTTSTKNSPKKDIAAITLSEDELVKELQPIYEKYWKSWATNQPISVTRTFDSYTKKNAFGSEKKQDMKQKIHFVYYDQKNFSMDFDEKDKKNTQEFYSLQKQSGKLYFSRNEHSDQKINSITQGESTFYNKLEDLLLMNVFGDLAVEGKIKGSPKKLLHKNSVVYQLKVTDDDGDEKKLSIQVFSEKLIIEAKEDDIDSQTKTTFELLPTDSSKKQPKVKGEEIRKIGTKADMYATLSHDDCFSGKTFAVDTHGFTIIPVMDLEEKFALIQVYSDVYTDLEVTIEAGEVPKDGKLIVVDDQKNWQEIKSIQTDNFTGKIYTDAENERLIFVSEKGDIPIKAQLSSMKPVQELEQLLFEKIINSIYLY